MVLVGRCSQPAMETGIGKKSVKDSVRRIKSKHAIARPGGHILRLWMVDPGITLQNIAEDNDGHGRSEAELFRSTGELEREMSKP